MTTGDPTALVRAIADVLAGEAGADWHAAAIAADPQVRAEIALVGLRHRERRGAVAGVCLCGELWNDGRHLADVLLGPAQAASGQDRTTRL